MSQLSYFRQLSILIVLYTCFAACSSSKAEGEEEAFSENDSIAQDSIVFLEPDTIIPLTSEELMLSGIRLYPDSSVTYPSQKHRIKRIKYAQQASQSNLDSVGYVFTENLLNNIIPYWYGTTWSFEGHTAKPRDGEIACGYFVSTTLRDMGIQVNRYKLAQQNPRNEAITINLNPEILEVSHFELQDSIDELSEKLKEGIYFIGFDYGHVGYILKRKEKLFLIHSNYLKGHVDIERIHDSDVFKAYNTYYIAEISTNQTLMKRWLNGEAISVYMGT